MRLSPRLGAVHPVEDEAIFDKACGDLDDTSIDPKTGLFGRAPKMLAQISAPNCGK